MRPRVRLRPLAVVSAVLASLLASAAVAQEDGQGTGREAGAAYQVPGLEREVEIVVDEWGVSHIYAENTDDLFHAQGFAAARDRLFQMDTWRRNGLGQLSEVLGPDFVAKDTASRLLLYRGDMAAEWASYTPGMRRIATAFAEGVNAYLGWLAEHPEAMPEEFTRLGYEPERWSAEDVVRIRSHALGANLNTEVARAQVVCLGGAEASRYMSTLQPAHTPAVPEGLDPCAIPADVTAQFDLGTAAVTFSEAAGGMRIEDPVTDALADATSGSNAWAVAPERTATGRPVLAGDPHRTSGGAPANRHLVHLSAPGLDVVGAGEPWNPGISLGHNGEAAFALTNLPVDQTDLYVYELDPDDPGRYRYGDGWEEFETVEESIEVAGGPSETARLRFTRHGPVIRVDEEAGLAYAVRTVWTEPGTSPYLGSLNFLDAGNVEEFTEALDTWRTPSSNLVYADDSGDVALLPRGLAPRRVGDGYDGLMPVPGDGRHEWDGFHAPEDMPDVVNPEEAYVASANEYNFPDDHPFAVAYEWGPPFRMERLDEVLAEAERATVADSLALQQDIASTLPEQLLPYLDDLSSSDPDTAAALDLVRSYDGVASEDSAAAVLYEAWVMQTLPFAWVNTVFPEGAHHPIFSFFPAHSVHLESFAAPEEWFGPDGAAVRDRLLLDTLGQAFGVVSARMGPDPASWRWGDFHHHVFRGPLGDEVARTSLPGSYYSVRASMYHPLTGEQIVGPTFKMVVDVGAWDRSRAINAPGQSGDPDSPHYTDLHGMWAEGQTFPLLYGDRAVRRHAEERLRLLPAR
ncbi:penicillin acylase family protein [Streptomyces sp. 4N509B]|uniref:penicillin acylase family protein n=1 Tax=Streptomyces sp. 4N509B TaxID=3457413 RepID=UPI003FD50322